MPCSLPQGSNAPFAADVRETMLYFRIFAAENDGIDVFGCSYLGKRSCNKERQQEGVS